MEEWLGLTFQQRGIYAADMIAKKELLGYSEVSCKNTTINHFNYEEGHERCKITDSKPRFHNRVPELITHDDSDCERGESSSHVKSNQTRNRHTQQAARF